MSDWRDYSFWTHNSPYSSEDSDVERHWYKFFTDLNNRFKLYNGRLQYNVKDNTVRLVNDKGTFYNTGTVILPNGLKATYDRKTGLINYPKKVASEDVISKTKNDPTPTKTDGPKPALDAARPSVNTGQSSAWYNKFLNSKGQFNISRTDLESWANQFGDGAAKNYVKGWAGKSDRALWKDSGSGMSLVFRNFTNWVKNNRGDNSNPLATANSNYTYSKNNGWTFNNGSLGQVNVTEGTTNPYTNNLSSALLVPKPEDAKINILVPKVLTNYNRADTRSYMRNNNINPYDYTGAERHALRNYLNGDTTGKNYDINLLKGSELGNKLNLKFQKGGSINMDEQQLQLAFLQYLMQKTGAQDQQQLEQVIQQMGEDGLKLAYAQFIQEMLQQQVLAAKFGAKLNYIRRLNGQCPEGMEMYYYKVGGRLCKKCMLAKLNERKGEEPSNPIDAFKCGRKIKKNQQGRKFPLIETDKNGKNKKVYYKDEATRDSIAANRYNDLEILVNRPGSYKKNAKGKVQWTPDRTKAPYKKG